MGGLVSVVPFSTDERRKFPLLGFALRSGAGSSAQAAEAVDVAVASPCSFETLMTPVTAAAAPPTLAPSSSLSNEVRCLLFFCFSLLRSPTGRSPVGAEAVGEFVVVAPSHPFEMPPSTAAATSALAPSAPFSTGERRLLAFFWVFSRSVAEEEGVGDFAPLFSSSFEALSLAAAVAAASYVAVPFASFFVKERRLLLSFFGFALPSREGSPAVGVLEDAADVVIVSSCSFEERTFSVGKGSTVVAAMPPSDAFPSEGATAVLVPCFPEVSTWIIFDKQ